MRIIVLVVVLLLTGSQAQAQEVNRQISPLGDGIYRFQNNFHVSIFVVTDAGVVVTDPINAEAAAWLTQEIGKMTNQPITHLIYSHSHGDHASGGTEFGDGLTVIAHQNAPEDIDLVEPTIRFSDSGSIAVGNKVFELTYLGPGHGTDLIAIVVRPDNLAFVVDAVSAKRLYYRDFPGSNVDDWISQVEKVNSLEFDTFVGGHGPVGTKADVAAGLQYLRELRTEVLAGLKAGQSVSELKKTVTMKKYSNWQAYDMWLGLNIEGMARHLQRTGLAN